MDYILLLIGFVLLIKGADIFVDGASKISRKLGIPSIIVGLTIVSLGTSAPELAVSIVSSLKGSNDMSVGNVLGSNLFNILAVLGTTALVSKVVIHKKEAKRDYLATLLSSILFVALTFVVFSQGAASIVSRVDGLILTSACVFYTILLIKSALKDNKSIEEKEDTSDINVLLCIGKIVVGVIAIIFGGNLVVDSASTIAMSFGMTEKLVGLTIVAVGTSLPELVTSVVAARKGENEIALGNVLGSSIFNILLIIGLSALISPITVSTALLTDFIFLIIVILILGVLIFFNKSESKTLSKLEAILFISLYIGYVVFIIFRN